MALYTVLNRSNSKMSIPAPVNQVLEALLVTF